MKKLALIGNGRVAAHYKYIFEMYFEHEEYTFEHLIDINTKQLSDPFFSNATKHSSINDFLSSVCARELDFCIVCSPSYLHFEHASLLMKAGVTPIVEKPPVLKLDEFGQLKELSIQTGIKPVFIFQNRLNPAVQKVKEIIESGDLGKVITAAVVLRWCREDDYYTDDWHGRWEFDGGVSAQQGIHHIDALQYLLGPAISVQAEYDTIVNKMDAEDTLVGIAKLENGTLATIELTVAARPKDIEASITITGTRGNVKIGGIALNTIERLELVSGDNLIDCTTDEFNDVITQGYGISHHRQLKQIFYNDHETPFHLIEVEDTVRLLHALLAASETNEKQYLEKLTPSNMLGVRRG